MPFTFKVGQKIKEAWALYKENFGSIIALTLVLVAIQILSQSVSKNGNNIILMLLLILVSVFVGYIWIKSTIGLLDGKGFNPFSKETLPSFSQIWDFVKTNILVALCVVPFLIIPIGIIFVTIFVGILFAQINILFLLIMIPIIALFIIPGIYITSRLFPAKYLSVEKCQGARKSISEAWNMTRGNGWRITWKIIVIGLFMALGFVAFFVGAIITYPIGMIVLTMMYRDLAKDKVMSEITPTSEVLTPEVKEEVKTEEKVEVSSEPTIVPTEGEVK